MKRRPNATAIRSRSLFALDKRRSPWIILVEGNAFRRRIRARAIAKDRMAPFAGTRIDPSRAKVTA
jgi:hypothetical protein